MPNERISTAIARFASLAGELVRDKQCVTDQAVATYCGDNLSSEETRSASLLLDLLNRPPEATDDATVMALAALARLGTEWTGDSAGVPSGFTAPHLDARFDAAIEFYVREKVWQSESRPQNLQERFAPDGSVQLIISTAQTDVAKIGHSGNIGDNFGLHVCKWLSSKPIQVEGVWSDKTKPVFLTVGSFIQHARNRGLVWGTGSIAPMQWKERPVRTDSIFLGVRGPRTREQVLRRFGLTPPVVGDPGLLFSQLVRDPNLPITEEVGFIVHGVDRKDFESRWPGKYMIRNTGSLEAFREDLSRCRHIVSTSLHGMIFSHSAQKPTAIVRIGDRLSGGEFKFIDYHQSLGHYDFQSRTPLDYADGEENWAELAAASWRPKDLMLERLLETFPFH